MSYMDILRIAYRNYQVSRQEMEEADRNLKSCEVPSPPAVVERNEQVKIYLEEREKALQDEVTLYDVRQDKEAAMIERLHELERAIPIMDTWFLMDDVFIRQTVRGGVDIVPVAEVLNWMTYGIGQTITDEEVERRR